MKNKYIINANTRFCRPTTAFALQFQSWTKVIPSQNYTQGISFQRKYFQYLKTSTSYQRMTFSLSRFKDGLSSQKLDIFKMFYDYFIF